MDRVWKNDVADQRYNYVKDVGQKSYAEGVKLLYTRSSTMETPEPCTRTLEVGRGLHGKVYVVIATMHLCWWWENFSKCSTS